MTRTNLLRAWRVSASRIRTASTLPWRAFEFVAFVAAYVTFGEISLWTSYVQFNTATVWLPTGFSIGVLIARGPWLWPAVAAASFALNLMINLSTQAMAPLAVDVIASLCIAAGNTGEALLGWYLTNRFAGGQALLARSRNVFAFALTAVFIPPVLSAACGLVGSRLFGVAKSSDGGQIGLTWYAANALSSLLYVGPTLALFQPHRPAIHNPTRLFEGILLVCVIVFVTQDISGVVIIATLRDWPRTYMVIPVLLWATFRFGTPGALLSIVLITAISVVGTMRGFQAFPAPSASLSLLYLQMFLGCLSITILSIAAGLTEVDMLRSGLEKQVDVQTSEVERLLRAREAFTNLVVHDLRSPLMASGTPCARPFRRSRMIGSRSIN